MTPGSRDLRAENVRNRDGGGEVDILCLETSQNDNNKNSVCLCSHK